MATFVRTQEASHEVGAHGRLAVRVTSSDVELRAIDGPEARARITFEIRASDDREADDIFDRVRFTVTESPGSFEIAEPKQAAHARGSLGRLLGAGRERIDARVELDAPRGCDLVYDGVSADVTATGFAGPQRYRTVSGDLVLDGFAGDVRINGVSSDVSLRTDASLPTLEVTTVSGDVSAVAARIDQLRLVTVSGDLEVEAELGDGPAHRVETVSGDLSLGVIGSLTIEVRGLSSDVDVRLPHRSEGSRERRRYVIGDGRPQLLFSSMSGDANVRPPRRGGFPAPPRPIAPPPPPAPGPPPAAGGQEEELAILRALERGEIDVDEAARRLGGRDEA